MKKLLLILAILPLFATAQLDTFRTTIQGDGVTTDYVLYVGNWNTFTGCIITTPMYSMSVATSPALYRPYFVNDSIRFSLFNIFDLTRTPYPIWHPVRGTTAVKVECYGSY